MREQSLFTYLIINGVTAAVLAKLSCFSVNYFLSIFISLFASAGVAASCLMMMEDDDHSHYISQLRAEFDSCDTSASGFLERDELTALCQKLHLEAHLQQLLDTLLGHRACGRVNVHTVCTNWQ